MIDNDEGWPTGAEDKGIWAISPCLSCPECGEGGDLLDKRHDEYTGVTDAHCWNCGAHWYETGFDDGGTDE